MLHLLCLLLLAFYQCKEFIMEFQVVAGSVFKAPVTSIKIINGQANFPKVISSDAPIPNAILISDNEGISSGVVTFLPPLKQIAWFVQYDRVSNLSFSPFIIPTQPSHRIACQYNNSGINGPFRFFFKWFDQNTKRDD